MELIVNESERPDIQDEIHNTIEAIQDE